LNSIKILHITEALGGGVTTAINTYVRHSPNFEHHLVAAIRQGDVTGEESNGGFNSIQLVKKNLQGLSKCVSVIKELNPDVIHLHSTYAGFFLRLHPSIDKSKIVYTPHGFAFLRDDNVMLKRFYYLVEKILASKARYVAGCGEDEANLAHSFGPKVRVYSLVNVCEPISDKVEPHNQIKPRIGMVGRITPQKGYRFFADVASKFKNDAEFIWLGSGDEKGQTQLEEAGVNVTGWLTRPQVLQRLVTLDYYFHSAAWDGFPVSVLEAAEVGLPIVLREIGPFSAEGLSCVSDEGAAVDEIAKLILGDSSANRRAIKNCDDIRRSHTSENLAAALEFIYNKVGS
jgi:glycosyltransferase involved in cell wall biosynthesis